MKYYMYFFNISVITEDEEKFVLNSMKHPSNEDLMNNEKSNLELVNIKNKYVNAIKHQIKNYK